MARISASDGTSFVVRVRLVPTPRQVGLLRSYCGTARAVYNSLLFAVRANLGQREAERSYGIPDELLTPAMSWHKYGLEAHLRAHRDQLIPWHAEVPWQVLDLTGHHLAVGLARFTSGQGRFPAFKRKHGPDAGLVPVTFRDTKTDWLTEGGRRIRLPVSVATKLALSAEHGHARADAASRVLAVKDRRARRAFALVKAGRAQVQTVTFSHTGGHWFAAVRLRVLPKHLPQPQTRAPRETAALGVDAGMGATFATLNRPVPGLTDDAGKIPAPWYLRRALGQLAEAQAWLARTRPGSKRRAKALRRVQRLHGRVAGRRETFHHEVAIALATAAPAVGVEDLNLRGMARRRGTDGTSKRGFRFSRSVADNGWAAFVTVLTGQATTRGAAMVKADRFYPSSKTCSGCGTAKAKLSLSERTFTCTECGLVLDRDVNAAVNLAAHAARVTAASIISTTSSIEQDGVSDAGEASSIQTAPSGDGAAAAHPHPPRPRQRPRQGRGERRVPDPAGATSA